MSDATTAGPEIASLSTPEHQARDDTDDASDATLHHLSVAALDDRIRAALADRPVPISIAPGQTILDIKRYAQEEARTALHPSPAVFMPARERLRRLGVLLDGEEGQVSLS